MFNTENRLILTDIEKKMLDGDRGDAVRMAMSILADIGDAIGARQMVKISHVHTDSGFYLGDAGLDFVEKLVSLDAKVAVPTTMNNTSFDIERCRDYGASQETAQKMKRMEAAHLAMGADPTWTCAPYQDGVLPQKNERIAWSESNAIAFANSVLGARTNRTGDLVDICCALTGRAPETGLYLKENRLAGLHLELEGFPADVFQNPGLYPLLGYLAGKECGNRIPAVTGLPPILSMDDLKGFAAAAASSGATALFHIAGITPEAPSLNACCSASLPPEKIIVTPRDIGKTEALLCTNTDDRLDWVGLGCPHFSQTEFMALIQCLDRLAGSKTIHSNVAFSIFTSRNVREEIKSSKIYDRLHAAGIEIYTDGCLLLYPQSLEAGGTMMTNSAKAANYIYSQAGFKAAYGTIEECVESALAGKIIRRRPVWFRS